MRRLIISDMEHGRILNILTEYKKSMIKQYDESNTVEFWKEASKIQEAISLFSSAEAI